MATEFAVTNLKDFSRLRDEQFSKKKAEKLLNSEEIESKSLKLTKNQNQKTPKREENRIDIKFRPANVEKLKKRGKKEKF